MQLKFIDFFAGIGGISLGLERAGHECVAQVEIDPYCNRVLAHHWPDVPRWGDITELNPDELPEADLWAGGFPCQDISNAGKREGIDGARSGLFFDWMHAVRLVRPSRLLLENVAALLGRGMDRVLGELSESRYDAEWDCIPAAAVGAPHLRERVFVVAYPAGGRCTRVYVPVRSWGSWEAAADDTRMGEALADADAARLTNDQGECPAPRPPRRPPVGSIVGRPGSWWETEPDLVRVVHGVSDALDRVRGLGNAVVPQVAEIIGRLLMDGQHGGDG